jgi:hypothetical protein
MPSVAREFEGDATTHEAEVRPRDRRRRVYATPCGSRVKSPKTTGQHLLRQGASNKIMGVSEFDLGNVENIVELIVTIAGFALTWWQIHKTKSASLQAKEAAESVRTQILQLNTIQDINAASKAFEDIRRLHRLKAWEALPDRYTSLKQQLISIKGRTPHLSDGQKTQIQGAIQQVSNIERIIEVAISGTEEPEVHRVNDVISRQIDRLAQVLVDVQNDIDRGK